MTKSSPVDKLIKILTHAKDPSPQNLSKYEIFIAGGYLGATLTKNFSQKTHGHRTQFISFLDPKPANTVCRVPYEMKFFNRMSYFTEIKKVMCLSVAHCNGVGVKSIQPDRNLVTLNNGREIEYGILVNAMGLNPDVNQVKGLQEAVDDRYCPVYSTFDSVELGKPNGFISLFTHGNAYIYIPPFEFSGEVENYNFLVALETWVNSVKAGVVSPKHHLTIVNANDRFAHKSDQLNSFINEELSNYSNVTVISNTRLTEIDKDSMKVTLVDSNNIERREDFHSLYVHVPSSPNPALKDSGLMNANGLTMPVNPTTLQHPKYSNVFGVGDVCDLNIQKSFLAGIYQSHVVRHNALQLLGGKTPNAEYKGNSELNFYTGLARMAKYSENSEKGESLDTDFQKPRYRLNSLVAGKKLLNIFRGANPGPPKNKLGYQKFPDGEAIVKSEKA